MPRIRLNVVSTCYFTYLLLLLLLIAPTLSFSKGSNDRMMLRTQEEEEEARIHSICSQTQYPDLCIKDLFSSASSRPNLILGLPDLNLVTAALNAALGRVNDAFHMATDLTAQDGYLFETKVLRDCANLMSDVGALLEDIAHILSSFTLSLPTLKQEVRKIGILLSSSIGLQSACTDGFSLFSQYSGRSSRMLDQESDVSKGIANCFSLVSLLSKLLPHGDNQKLPHSIPAKGHARRLLLDSPEDAVGIAPGWLNPSMRKLLQSAPSDSTPPDIDVVVAQDGSGDYTSIQAAVDNVPEDYISDRYVIYIKEGIYNEIVVVPKRHENLAFLGDGIDRTIITGDRNVAVQNYTTYQSATVAVSAPGFMASGITFRNTAGPAGHQAVALRATGDLSVFDTCSFEGYQDTLYALAGRQLYQNCDIYGTVDYIFGNAIAVFQNCNLYARLPLQGQQNTYTAQGRKIPDDPSGYSFQNCTVTADQELLSAPYNVGTYLGRPWKTYSRTVFIDSYMGSIVEAVGWLAWNSSEPYEDTLYYGEYENRGPGSNISQRVTWPGVHSSMTPDEASVFSPDNFIAAPS